MCIITTLVPLLSMVSETITTSLTKSQMPCPLPWSHNLASLSASPQHPSIAGTQLCEKNVCLSEEVEGLAFILVLSTMQQDTG